MRDRLAVFLLVHGACTYPNPAFNVDTNGSGTGGSSIAEDGTVSTTDPTIGSTGGSTGGATGGSTGGLTGGLTGGSTGGSTGDSPTTDPCDSAACVCEPGLVEPCYEGPPGSEDVGECIAGTRVCARDGGAWGPCNDAVEPTPEVCDNGLDDNCDDALDESSCEGSCPVMDGLVACYLFPEGETSQLVDGSGNGHHGAMTAVELVDGAPQQGKAGQFSARSQAQIPNDEAFNPALFTIAMLAAPSPAAGEVTLVDKDNQFVVSRNGSSISCLVVTEMGNVGGASVSAANDTWSHIACAFDGKKVTLWRHGAGEAMQSNSLLGSLGKNNGGIQVGKNSPELDKAYLGKLDRVLFFERALSGDEVCKLAGPLCP